MVARTKAAGHVAVAGAAGLWLVAGACFVSSAGPSKSALRGTGHELAHQRFVQAPVQEQASEGFSWSSVMGMAAACGLVISMTTSPVRAEEAAAEAPKSAVEIFKEQSAKEEAARAGALSKEERLAKQTAAMKAVEIDGEFAAAKAAKPATKAAKVIKKESKKAEEGGGFSFTLPSFSSGGGDSKAAPVDASKKLGKFISPADELDEDELSLSRSNPVALFLLAVSAPAIYLVFYVFGSLEII
jgi:hypothetical protein